jgi:hypothetical protein
VPAATRSAFLSVSSLIDLQSLLPTASSQPCRVVAIALSSIPSLCDIGIDCGGTYQQQLVVKRAWAARFQLRARKRSLMLAYIA